MLIVVICAPLCCTLMLNGAICAPLCCTLMLNGAICAPLCCTLMLICTLCTPVLHDNADWCNLSTFCCALMLIGAICAFLCCTIMLIVAICAPLCCSLMLIGAICAPLCSLMLIGAICAPLCCTLMLIGAPDSPFVLIGIVLYCTPAFSFSRHELRRWILKKLFLINSKSWRLHRDILLSFRSWEYELEWLWQFGYELLWERWCVFGFLNKNLFWTAEPLTGDSECNGCRILKRCVGRWTRKIRSLFWVRVSSRRARAVCTKRAIRRRRESAAKVKRLPIDCELLAVAAA